MADKTLVERLEKLIDIGIALSTETDTQRLLEMILKCAMAITNADGGTLYSIEKKAVKMEIMITKSLNFAMGGTTGNHIPFHPISLYTTSGKPNKRNVVTCAVLNQQTVNIADAYNVEGFDFSGTYNFDRKTGYRSTSLLTVPMKNHEGDIIGALQLLNALDRHDNIIAFDQIAQRLTEALASQAAIALTQKQLIDGLKQLFESLIHLIADAIDQKSPYTGGHCRRVPELTMMLAEAAHNTENGPLKDFRMTDKDRYELKIAGWLHDCGKITTPEYVVDKATKLETIYDRIHTTDTRFEVLKRDAEIAFLKAKLAAQAQNGATFDGSALERQFQQRLEHIANDQAFLHRCNIGGEFMSECDQKRVSDIGQQTWHFKGKECNFLSNDEIYNLNIPKGTLTAEEREVINHHIIATIKMLESLPFPKHLKHVPEYAGGHHERMDGKGYPNGLTKEQMPVQARIMAIADIYEALTAKDRPYKSGKMLSESLAIMSHMSKTGHIDPDLFEIFLKKNVYLEYANKFLDGAQIDTPKMEELLS